MCGSEHRLCPQLVTRTVPGATNYPRVAWPGKGLGALRQLRARISPAIRLAMALGSGGTLRIGQVIPPGRSFGRWMCVPAGSRHKRGVVEPASSEREGCAYVGDRREVQREHTHRGSRALGASYMSGPFDPRQSLPPPPPPGWQAQPPPPWQPQPWAGPAPPPGGSTNGFAIASMVLGIVWVYWVGSVLALIFGYVALRQIKRSNGWQQGRGMAIAGVVLGWIGMATLVLMITLYAITRSLRDDGYGDDAELDALWDRCDAGEMVYCDVLYERSPVGSEYEEFGETCGARVEDNPGDWCVRLDP